MIDISFPDTLPSRKAARSLREHLVSQLIAQRPAVGDKFFTDSELVARTGLSRSTVRRALEDLQRDGWLERQNGLGTFIGPRVLLPAAPARRDSARGHELVRLAVLVSFLEQWFAPPVLQGIDERAGELGIVVELVGQRQGDVRKVIQRLLQSRPDVLCCPVPTFKQAEVFAEARRLGIPLIGAGTRVIDFQMSGIMEDGHQGASLAVDHLADRGHRRIANVQACVSVPAVFHRYQGFCDAMLARGLDPDGMTLWMPQEEYESADPRAGAERLRRFLRDHRPTAIVLGGRPLERFIGELIAASELRVPEQLSIISFDIPAPVRWLGDRNPTHIELPLTAMGRRLAELAREIIDGRPPNGIERLPCHLVDGHSVLTLATSSQM
jgi:GntR family transcriptional regulator of arabinose operon